MSSSLSSVVSNLMRASMGSAVSSTVQDDDLDRHVAELILREAKKKAERYGQQGIRAYISNNLSDSNAPRTNKRFLSSIIKSTDEHNKTVLKAQALAAQEVKRERAEQERRERRARAEEAAEAERLRRSGRSHKRRRVDSDEGWDRWDGRTAERKRITRNWEDWDGGDDDDDESSDKGNGRRRNHTNSRSRERRKGKSSSRAHDQDRHKSSHKRRRSRSRDKGKDTATDSHEYPNEPRHGHRRHAGESRHTRSKRPRVDFSRSPSHPRRSRSCSSNNSSPRKRAPKYALDDIYDVWVPRSPSRLSRGTSDHRDSLPREQPMATHSSQGSSTTLIGSHPSHASSQPRPDALHKRIPSPVLVHSRSPSPGPQLALQLPSKMDKYFEETYDPRLDVAPLPAPKVPATGLIDNADFEGWDAMLELIRIRREDKEEKRRLERLGIITKDRPKVKKSGTVVQSTAAVADRWGSESVSVMDIEYKKRGSVREWDMGKVGL